MGQTESSGSGKQSPFVAFTVCPPVFVRTSRGVIESNVAQIGRRQTRGLSTASCARRECWVSGHPSLRHLSIGRVDVFIQFFNWLRITVQCPVRLSVASIKLSKGGPRNGGEILLTSPPARGHGPWLSVLSECNSLNCTEPHSHLLGTPPPNRARSPSAYRAGGFWPFGTIIIKTRDAARVVRRIYPCETRVREEYT